MRLNRAGDKWEISGIGLIGAELVSQPKENVGKYCYLSQAHGIPFSCNIDKDFHDVNLCGRETLTRENHSTNTHFRRYDGVEKARKESNRQETRRFSCYDQARLHCKKSITDNLPSYRNEYEEPIHAYALCVESREISRLTFLKNRLGTSAKIIEISCNNS